MTEQGAPQKIDMKTLAMVMYGCWAAGVLSHIIPMLGILPLVALIIAIIKRKEAAGTIYESHFVWVIRSFVIGIVVVIVGMIFMMVPLINILSSLAFVGLFLWSLYRLVKGGLRLMENKPIENPDAYL